MPDISVIMPVYNALPYLGQAIESILAQTHHNFEFIIINDASSDGSLAVIQGYADPRIKLIDLAHNGGQTAALNHGLRAASGTFIARQDADDASLPERFAQQIAFLHAHPDHWLIGTAVEIIDQHNRLMYIDQRPESDAAIRQAIAEGYGSPIIHGAAMWRRAVLERVGLYREGFRTSQDYDYWLRIGEQGKFANLGLPALYQYRMHAAQMSYTSYHRMQAEWALIDHLAAIRATGDDDQAIYERETRALTEKFQNFQPTSAQKRRVQAEMQRNRGTTDLKRGAYASALYHIGRAFLTEPTNPNFWKALRGRVRHKARN